MLAGATTQASPFGVVIRSFIAWQHLPINTKVPSAFCTHRTLAMAQLSVTQQSMRSNTWAHSLSLSLCYSAADEYRWLSNLFPFLRSEASADIRHACVSNSFSNSTSPPHMWRALFNFAFASSSSSSRNTHTYALCMCPYCLDLHILLGDSWAETDACAPGTECDCDCVLENSIYELQ